jgi:hypothetical protein
MEPNMSELTLLDASEVARRLGMDSYEASEYARLVKGLVKAGLIKEVALPRGIRRRFTLGSVQSCLARMHGTAQPSA